MCLAVPVRIVEVSKEGSARVQVGHGENYMEISTILLPQPPQPGDYVIVHAGFALRLLDAAEAEESLNIFRQIAALGVNEGRDLESV